MAHPWHGIPVGDDAPQVVNTFIEMIPTDTVKYEIDKLTGHRKVDRPQKYSSFCPAPYGFIPQTLCGDTVANISMERTGRKKITGDGDPMDICVLTERPINHGMIILKAKPIGGIRLFDGGEADDKIISVLSNDAAYADFDDITDIPTGILERIRHYFLTYKQMPSASENKKSLVTISHVFGQREAVELIAAAIRDYQNLIESD